MRLDILRILWCMFDAPMIIPILIQVVAAAEWGAALNNVKLREGQRWIMLSCVRGSVG